MLSSTLEFLYLAVGWQGMMAPHMSPSDFIRRVNDDKVCFVFIYVSMCNLNGETLICADA